MREVGLFSFVYHLNIHAGNTGKSLSHITFHSGKAHLCPSLLILVVGAHPPTPTIWTDAGEEKIVEGGDSHILSRKLSKVASRCRTAQFEFQSPVKIWQLVGNVNKASKISLAAFSFEDALMCVWS